MPQLDTSTWFTTIISMLFTLFIFFQLKISKYTYLLITSPKTMQLEKHKTPWKIKWTKTYLPLSLPPQ